MLKKTRLDLHARRRVGSSCIFKQLYLTATGRREEAAGQHDQASYNQNRERLWAAHRKFQVVGWICIYMY